VADFKKLLANANKTWKKAAKRVGEDEGPGFAEIPDGRYTAQLVSAKLAQSNAGRLQIDYAWKIQDGEYEGKTKHAYQGLESEDNLYYMGRDLIRLGYEAPDSLEDLPDILEDISKAQPIGTITLQSKGDFQNVYIRKIFKSDEEEEETDGDEDVEDEETEEVEEEAEEEEEADEETEEEEEAEEEEEEEADEEEADEEEEEEESDEEADEEDDEDVVDLEIGMRVIAETAKGREAGAVVGILEKEQKVRVELDNGKTVRVDVDKIEVEPPKKVKPAPAKKPAAKPAPAPAKKPVKKPAPAPVKKGVAKKKTRR
jgi:cobalamin biosynthesis protein CobT